MFFDPYYLLFALPGLILALIAQSMVKSAYAKYSRVGASSGMTGAQAAQCLLDRAGIHDVNIVRVRGFLSDHYNPSNKTLALSDDNFDGRSLSAIGVSTHEAGHAIQHATSYAMLGLRSALVPMAGIGSNFAFIVFFIGLFIHPALVIGGLVLFSAVVIFQLVTLPVEFDASARAKKLVVEAGIIRPEERKGIDAVLNAAALTYVAAALQSIMTLFYLLMRSGLLGRRD